MRQALSNACAAHAKPRPANPYYGDSALSREKVAEIRGRLQAKQTLAAGGKIRVIERPDLHRPISQHA